MDRYRAQVWLVKTGWPGEAYGEGKRLDIHLTRNMVRAALGGSLDGVEFALDKLFQV